MSLYNLIYSVKHFNTNKYENKIFFEAVTGISQIWLIKTSYME